MRLNPSNESYTRLRVSGRTEQLSADSAFVVLARAQALEARGMNIVHLEIGEPCFSTPENICEAGRQAITDGHTRYCNSQGIVPLREEIAREILKTRGVEVSPDRVVVGSGAKPLIFFAMLAVLDEGDEAIYPAPLFSVFQSAIGFAGAVPVPLPLSEELDFRFDLEDLRSRITSRTKLVVLNSPHNPTGGVLSKSDVEGIAAIARENDLLVLSDEVYDHMYYEDAPASIMSIEGMSDRVILVSGFSKTYAMTGWRLGYAVMPDWLIGTVVRLINSSSSCTSQFVQEAGLQALLGDQGDSQKMMRALRDRRDLMINGLNSIPGINCRVPLGAFYAFPNVSRLGLSSAELATLLLEEGGVATLPGTAFGPEGEGYLRLCFSTSVESIEEALDRFRRIAAGLYSG
ncbi:pyridoxal phosphate-dependent aminotransferase [Candidatus Bipolaricaulota bacterium]|nr:pyridoxal phosphate-dependent aminotransferase [Candidatus Bipolaricaulota bacterium]